MALFSSQKPTLRALLGSADVEEALREALETAEGLQLEVVQGNLVQRAGQLTSPNLPDILLVDLDLEDSAQLELLEKLVQNGAAGTPVIATSRTGSVDGVRALMRLQIADYLPQPLVQEDVLSVIEAAFRQRKVAQGGPAGSMTRVLSFAKPMGGVGSTMLAIQTAFELAKRGKGLTKPNVCYVDLDFQFGSSFIYLDLDPNLKIPEIAEAPDRMDSALLASMNSRHPAGVDVFASQNIFEYWGQITPEVVARLLEVICDEYDYVVIDHPQTWQSWTPDILAGSDMTLLVTLLSVAGIRQARQYLNIAGQQHIEDHAIQIVLNRHNSSMFSGGLKVKEAERALGRNIDHFILSDYKLVSEALDQGVPISEIKRRSKVEKNISAMTDACLTAIQAHAAEAV